jgi:FkbM family methyltransferase
VLTEPTGFYVDVGASHPTTHSVSRHFYDRGWRGINIEPRASSAEAFQRERPRDVNLQVVVGRTEGETLFYDLVRPELGELATSVPACAVELKKVGHEIVEQKIAATTLARVCEQHAPARIDFMSIDVEGAESDVIAGGDWKRWRPRVLVVEDLMLPALTSTHAEWEPMLLAADYVFVVADGINRFYVPREEMSALGETLARPVSWLDRYEPFEYVQELERLRQLIAAPGAPVATRALVDAAEQQAAASWAAYDGMRGDLQRLRNRVAMFERALAGRGPELAGNGTQAPPPAETSGVPLAAPAVPAGPAVHDRVGPIWLALAARMTRLSRRSPRVSTAIKQRVLRANLTLRRIRGL